MEEGTHSNTAEEQMTRKLSDNARRDAFAIQ